jgi:hypothetical protein
VILPAARALYRYQQADAFKDAPPPALTAGDDVIEYSGRTDPMNRSTYPVVSSIET